MWVSCELSQGCFSYVFDKSNYFTFLCQYIGKMPDRAMDRVIMLIQTDRLTFEVDFQLFFVLKWTFSFGGHMDVNC